MSRRNYLLGIAVLLLGLLWWFWPRSRSGLGAGNDVPLAAVPRASDAARTDARSSPAPRSAAARARRDALRGAITQALAHPREAPSEPPPPSPAGANPLAPPAAPGQLRDRLGGRDALVAALNRQFMPLAQDCITRAQKDQPALHGLLALSIETLADEEHGAVVDVAEAAANNEVAQSDLWECIRESAYSLSLPPPPARGREKFMLTLPIDPIGPNDAPSGRGLPAARGPTD